MSGRHNSFYISAIIGIVALAIGLIFLPRVAYVVAIDLFFLVYLLLTGAKMLKATPDLLRGNIASADEPVWIIFAVTFGAVVVAIGSLFVLINSAHRFYPLDLSLTLAAVPLGWLSIHMMAAVHYAHLYWQPGDAQGPDGKTHQNAGGLAFQGGREPGGIEFLYFAYVIGMAAETSDTAITSTQMRRTNLLHGIVSFFFNTVLVAAAVNVAVSLGQ